VWLAPEPPDRFVELIELTANRFPQWLPYGAAFEDVVPHLTIGSDENIDAMTSAAREEFGAVLPVPARATGVTLLEEQPDGTWADGTTFRLGVR
jgi:hypothetical protein